MENCNLCSLLRGDRFTTPVVEKSPPPTECIPFKIPLGIIEKVMNDYYEGDGTVHPSTHLLKLTELCELFKISGLTRDEVMRKLFALSLKGKALEWYRLLDDSHLMDWEEIQSLFYSKFYPLHEVHENRNYVYNFYPHDGESIAQAWRRLKTLMLQCPNHGLPKDMIITIFMRGSLDRIRICLMLPLWVLSQTKRLMLNGNSLKEFNAILKIGRSTKVKSQV